MILLLQAFASTASATTMIAATWPESVIKSGNDMLSTLQTLRAAEEQLETLP